MNANSIFNCKALANKRIVITVQLLKCCMAVTVSVFVWEEKRLHAFTSLVSWDAFIQEWDYRLFRATEQVRHKHSLHPRLLSNFKCCVSHFVTYVSSGSICKYILNPKAQNALTYLKLKETKCHFIRQFVLIWMQFLFNLPYLYFL